MITVVTQARNDERHTANMIETLDRIAKSQQLFLRKGSPVRIHSDDEAVAAGGPEPLSTAFVFYAKSTATTSCTPMESMSKRR